MSYRKSGLPSDTPTRRQLQIIEQIAKGLRYKEIGAVLGLAEKTVASHACQARLKLAVRSKVQLVEAAREKGLLAPSVSVDLLADVLEIKRRLESLERRCAQRNNTQPERD